MEPRGLEPLTSTLPEVMTITKPLINQHFQQLNSSKNDASTSKITSILTSIFIQEGSRYKLPFFI
jgi:hypothetical protein